MEIYKNGPKVLLFAAFSPITEQITLTNQYSNLHSMGDLDSIYLQGLAYLHSSDPASTKKLVNLCEELIASSEWAGVTISESGDLSSLVNPMLVLYTRTVDCNFSIKVFMTAVKFLSFIQPFQ